MWVSERAWAVNSGVFVCRHVHVLLHVLICKCISVYMVGLLYSVVWNISKKETQFWEPQKKKNRGRQSATAAIGLLTSATQHRDVGQKKLLQLLAVTPIPSSTGWGAVRLLNLHNSKGQSMEEGPFVRNCQRRQGPQAWSPRVKSAYLGCHSDMTGPQGQGRGVKLLTTLNVTPALL